MNLFKNKFSIYRTKYLYQTQRWHEQLPHKSKLNTALYLLLYVILFCRPCLSLFYFFNTLLLSLTHTFAFTQPLILLLHVELISIFWLLFYLFRPLYRCELKFGALGNNPAAYGWVNNLNISKLSKNWFMQII